MNEQLKHTLFHHHIFAPFIKSIIETSNFELKKRLEFDDLYIDFVVAKCSILLNRMLLLKDLHHLESVKAMNIVFEEFKLNCQ